MDRRPNRLIIAKYSAPKDLSLVSAAELLGEGRRAMAAQIIDFAVRRVITVSRPASASRRSGFTLAVARDPRTEGVEELDVLNAVFGAYPVRVGQSIEIRPRQNRAIGERLRAPHRRIAAYLITRGLAREKSLLTKLLRPWRKQPVVPTEAAQSLVDHLWGIHDYVKLAERDRYAMLQSPEGAPRSALDVLQLSEKLLPYAVLFGLEKQWAAQLDIQVGEVRRELPDFVDAADLVMLGANSLDAAAQVADLVDALPALADLVDLGDVLEGVGAVFGGIGEFLGSLSP